MPRSPRYREPGIPQHITKRGLNKDRIFRDTSDFHKMRQVLLARSKDLRVSIHHYAFLTNHIHLMATPHEADGISDLMQRAMTVYTQWYNAKYGRTGTIWEGRYWATTIDTESYFLRCACYIDLNPLRAGITARPGDYVWSSYRHYAQGTADRLVSEHELYVRLGRTTTERQAAYEKLVRSGISDEDVAYIRESTLTARVIGV